MITSDHHRQQSAKGDTEDLPSPPAVAQVEVGLLQNFCTLLYCADSREAALVDPAWEVDRLLREAARLDVRITKALITHGHPDHVEGIAELVSATGATVWVSAAETNRVRGVLRGSAVGQGADVAFQTVGDRDIVPIGKRGVRALLTPGHTAGGTCFLADGFVVTGDVLFVGGCGRTDFPGGDASQMWASLQRLAGLPEETVIYPGHNYGTTPTSTMGRELLENPYLRCASLDEFRALRERKRRA